jgi:multicomponent Na+:H+ antiporter subunit D
MWFTAVLFVLGAWGLSGCWPFGTLLGESMISDSASGLHQSWILYLFIFVEAITAGAVLRVFFRVFFGWGEAAPTDEASRVEERKETKENDHTPLMMFFPAAALILLGVSFIAIPGLRSNAEASAEFFTDQSSYAHAVLNSAEPAAAERKPAEPLSASILRCGIALLLAILLALGSILRKRTSGMLNFTRRLELGNAAIRKLHSGHPGDYVAWLSAGTAVICGCFLLFLR